MFKKNFYLLIFLLVTNCGFKTINDPSLNTYTVGDIKIVGDKKIGLIMQNQLMVASSKKSSNVLFFDITIKNEKSIKEKNISNKITKYNLTLNVTVRIKSENEIYQKNYRQSGSYDVSQNFSDTLRSEKNLETSLAAKISEKVINFLKIKYR